VIKLLRQWAALTAALTVLLFSSIAWAQDATMKSAQELLSYFMSGEGRLIAAGVLFVCIWILKNHFPVVNKWLGKDSGKYLSSKRKKLLSNIIMAMGPVAFMLTDSSADMREVGFAAVNIILMAMGVQGGLKALREKPAETIEKIKETIKDEEDEEEEEPVSKAKPKDKKKADEDDD